MMTFQRFSLRYVLVSLAVAAVILMLGVYDVSAQKPGTKKWTFTSKANFCSPVALGPNGTVYVGTFKQGDRGPLIALNANGKMKWGLPSKGAGLVLEAPVVGADGTVYVVPNNGILYAVRPTGSIKWKLSIRGSGGVGKGLALGHDGTIYVPAKNKSLVGVGPDGTKKWTAKIGSYSRGLPLVGPNGTIYAGHRRGVTAIKPDGTLKAEFGGSLSRAGAVDRDGTLYLNMGGDFYAMKSDGTKAWSFTTDSKTVPVIGPNGVIYAANSRGALYAFGRDGTKLWETSGNWGAGRYGDEAYPAVGSDGTIYVATERGKLYAFSSKGVKKWEADTGASRSRNPWPVIGPDGTVYVGTGYGKHGRGMVVAFHTGCRGPAASPWPMKRQNARNTGRAPTGVNTPAIPRRDLPMKRRNAPVIPKPDLPKKRRNAPDTTPAPVVPNVPVIPKPDLSNKDAYRVDRVVDGDTFVVAFPQTRTGIPKVTMRLIGVDAPQGVERYGKEASAFLTTLLKGKKVYTLWEGWKPTKDKGGRLFVYAYRAADGLFINAEIIRRGYGRVHKPFSFKHEKAFRKLEGIARNSKKGLWASAARQ